MPPLDAAIALAQMSHVAVPVAEHLHLDVQRAFDQPLGVERAGTECRLRLGGTAHECLGDILLAFDDPHPAAAAACDGFQDHRAVRLQVLVERLRLVPIVDHRRGRQDGQSIAGGKITRPELVAEETQHVSAWPHEDDPRRFARLGEFRILRQEAVAGMDRLAAPVPGNAHHLLDVEIRRRAGPVEFRRLVHRLDMQRLAVVGGMDPYRRDAHLPGSAVDANRDLAAVGNEQLARGLGVQHGVLRG